MVLEDGRPAGSGVVSRVWYAGRRMRLEPGGQAEGPALVLRIDEGNPTGSIPPRAVSWSSTSKRLRARAQMDLSLAGDLMGVGDERACTRTELPGAKTVAGHVCRGFRISGPSAVMDLYVATDLPVGISAFTEFLEWSGAAQSMAGFLAELRKLPGFPLQTRSRVSVLGAVQETPSTVTLVSRAG